MSKVFSIAIDGPAGAGKSTIAKALARELGAMYLDTGAMYRAFGLYMMRRGDTRDTAAVLACVDDVDVRVRFVDGVQRIFLGDEDVTEAIRAPEVSRAASDISSVAEVRERMVALQRRIAEGHSVVMDGRDIGTKVLPNATIKIYLTASAEVRAERRCKELKQKGMDVAFGDVLRDMIERDYQDSHRAASPLCAAEDAVLVDSTSLTLEEAVSEIKRLALAAIDRA